MFIIHYIFLDIIIISSIKATQTHNTDRQREIMWLKWDKVLMIILNTHKNESIHLFYSLKDSFTVKSLDFRLLHYLVCAATFAISTLTLFSLMLCFFLFLAQYIVILHLLFSYLLSPHTSTTALSFPILFIHPPTALSVLNHIKTQDQGLIHPTPGHNRPEHRKNNNEQISSGNELIMNGVG